MRRINQWRLRWSRGGGQLRPRFLAFPYFRTMQQNTVTMNSLISGYFAVSIKTLENQRLALLMVMSLMRDDIIAADVY